MSNNDEYIPRFSFEITEEQKQRASILLAQYGLRKAIFGRILDDVLDIISEYGPAALGVLFVEDVRPRDIIPTMHKAVEEAKK